MANETIREAAKSARVPLWKIALELGISEPTMTRRLRLSLEPEKERDILAIIERLAKEVV